MAFPLALGASALSGAGSSLFSNLPTYNHQLYKQGGTLGAIAHPGAYIEGMFLDGEQEDQDERQRKATAYNLMLEYNLNQQSLRDSPSAIKQGMEKANLNPLLALGSFGGAPTVGSSAAQIKDVFTRAANRMEVAAADQAQQIARQAKATADKTPEKIDQDIEESKARQEMYESQSTKNTVDSIVHIASPAATAFGGYKVAQALNAAKSAPVPNIPLSTVSNASKGLSVGGAMTLGQYMLGPAYSAWAVKKIMDNNKELEKKKLPKAYPSPRYMFH